MEIIYDCSFMPFIFIAILWLVIFTLVCCTSTLANVPITEIQNLELKMTVSYISFTY